MDEFYATVPYMNQTDRYFIIITKVADRDTRSLIKQCVPTRHEYNYLITLTLTLSRVPIWHEENNNSNSYPGRAGIASQTRYTTSTFVSKSNNFKMLFWVCTFRNFRKLTQDKNGFFFYSRFQFA